MMISLISDKFNQKLFHLIDFASELIFGQKMTMWHHIDSQLKVSYNIKNLSA